MSNTTVEQLKPHCPVEVNKSLNLNLGIPTWLLNPDNRQLRLFCRMLGKLVDLIEDYGIMLWIAIPLRYRHYISMILWKFYYAAHKAMLQNKTGIHKDASFEYHAMTSLMWWGNLLPVTIKRIRISLNQVQVLHPPTWYMNNSSKSDEDWSPIVTSKVGENIGTKSHSEEDEKVDETKVQEEEEDKGPLVYKIVDENDGKLIAYHIQLDKKGPSERVIFWLFGGAYLGGDCVGNLGVAEKAGIACNCDVFLVNYRLLPEYDLEDCRVDVISGYKFLVNNFDYKPENIYLLGISSGGGLAVSLMQELKEKGSKNILPAGAVLMSPFCDYTEPKGSFVEYRKHDLIVNSSVCEMGVPYFGIKLGCHENRVKASPVHGDFEGMPPLCVVVSNHESVRDQVMLLIDNAKKAGVDCTVGGE